VSSRHACEPLEVARSGLGYRSVRAERDNAAAEGLNSKIATVQNRACGYRSRDHCKVAVYFHCGGFNLYPACATHTKVG